MAYSDTPNRIRLAHLLQEAHQTQKYNTRRLEESYHALRTSTRRLELLWSDYSQELERELGVINWKEVPRLSTGMGIVQKQQPELNIDGDQGGSFSDLSSPAPFSFDGSQNPPPTYKPPPTLRARARSDNLQAPQPQSPLPTPTIQEPPATPAHTIPSRYRTAPSARRKPTPNERQAAHPPTSFLEVNTGIPRRHASLPTREYLVALSNSSASIPYPGLTKSHEAAQPDAKASHVPNTYSHSNANHASAIQNIGQTYAVEDFRNPMTHEALSYERGVQGHWGSPTDGEYSARTAEYHNGLSRKHQSERARLHKKR
ncbi:MAG: hypothetical protein Q9168_002120 [Polycauliona sp. 1 TL-2023]